MYQESFEDTLLHALDDIGTGAAAALFLAVLVGGVWLIAAQGQLQLPWGSVLRY